MVADSTRPRLSIVARLLGFSGIVLTVSMLIYGLVAFSAARNALRPSIREQLADDAVNAKSGLEELLIAHQLNVRTWAHLAIMRELVVHDMDKTISRFLNSVADDYAAYLDVVALDNEGICRAASSPSLLGQDLGWLLSASSPTPDSTRDNHRMARSTVHDAWYLPLLARVRDPDRPDRFLGWMVAMLDRRVLDRVVVPKPDHGHVELRLLDDDGDIIAGAGAPAHDTAAVDLQRWTPALPAPQRPLPGVRPIVHSGEDDSRREYVVAEVALETHDILPDLGWRLAAASPTDLAFAPLAEVQWRVLMSGAVLVAVGLLAAWLLAARISAPVRRLTAVATRIADSGELETIPDPVSNDEVGELTEAFQKMVQAVDSAHAEILRSSKLAFLGEISAGIAHEVRTPLGIIRNSAQLLERRARAGEDAEAVEWAVYIREECDRLNGVVRELLDLARPASPEPGVVDIAALLRRSVTFLAPEAGKRGITLASELAAELPDVWCDAGQIHQVMLNLVMNSLQACPAGATVTVAATAADDRVRIVVRDDGPGFPDEVLKRLFEPFTSQREGGVGLGLAIVRRLVHAHDGTIDVHNRDDGGAEITVELPLAASREELTT
jgi:two-component system sensor histidine kinase HydH